MLFLQKFNANNPVKTVQTVDKLAQQSNSAYSAPTPKLLTRADYSGELKVNNHAIENNLKITLQGVSYFAVDLWVNTVMALLEDNLANNKVFSDNLGLNFDLITIETKVKYATPIKPLRVVSDRVVQQKTDGWQYCWDITNPDDHSTFSLDKLKSVKGYLNGKAYPLYSVIGKCEVNPDKIIKQIPNFKVSPNLSTVSKIVPISVIGLTELSKQLNLTEVISKHNFILTCHHKGLVTLSYGDFTYNIAIIGLHKVTAYQYVDQTSCKISHYFNDIGISRYANGTEILNANGKGLKGEINLIHQTISKHYGKGWQIVKDNKDVIILTSTGKVILLASLIDNGLIATPSVFPIYDGILQPLTVDNLVSQVSSIIGRYLKLNTSLEINNTAKTFNDKLLKTYIKCYVYQTLMLQGVKVKTDFSIPVETVRKMLPSDQYLTTSKLSDKLTQAINRHGMQATKDAILTAKKMISFEEIDHNFISYM